MIRFEVSVNGQKICVAGSDCVLSVITTWAKHRADLVSFKVGGIDSPDSGEHIEWRTPQVGVGDEISIRIIEAELFDPPDRTYTPSHRRERTDESA